MSQYTILLASPDLQRSKILYHHLGEAGFRVLTSHNGERAIQMFGEETIHLLILDWKLPDLSGLAVIRIMRQEKMLDETPIIMISNQISEAERILALETGADLCLEEFCYPSVLVARVRALLGRIYNDPLEYTTVDYSFARKTPAMIGRVT